MDSFATKAALPLIAETFDGHADPTDLETYYSPDQSEEVQCTTQEREDFETECEVALTADVIEDQRDYDAFVRYLAENCGLERM